MRRLSSAGSPGIVPDDPVAFSAMVSAFVLDKAFYELEYELNTRPDWLRIPLAPWTHGRISPRETLPAYAAVQEDGTIVYAIAQGRRTALWTASPPYRRTATGTTPGCGANSPSTRPARLAARWR